MLLSCFVSVVNSQDIQVDNSIVMGLSDYCTIRWWIFQNKQGLPISSYLLCVTFAEDTN